MATEDNMQINTRVIKVAKTVLISLPTLKGKKGHCPLVTRVSPQIYEDKLASL